MDQQERGRLLKQIMWDYNIPAKDVDALLSGKKETAGHYSQSTFFKKVLESYSWYTVLQLYSPEEINNLLTEEIITGLRSPSLKKKYEFVKKRLQEIIPNSG
ncbi:MAG TPA: hypothetical protein PLZ75_08580 [Bacteroidales bacterium]|jgi:hypothetical protein|nr:hypothetical protein [Bacteroidales bacterium]HQH25356.1 hypothetical protein [Bacteroidales bacterium]HQJ82976.1 hypothetical protein [Bacteroidales bacterium]